MTIECCPVSQHVRESGLAQPLVSHHLRILRDAGLVRQERRGAYTYYCLVDPAVWEIVEACARAAYALGLVRPDAAPAGEKVS